MFFDLPSDKTCTHPEHEPPTGLYIPPGKGYRHVCPACKTVKDVIPPQYSLAQRAQRPSMKMLTLPLKREYFEAIRDGTKTEEINPLLTNHPQSLIINKLSYVLNITIRKTYVDYF